LAYTLFASGRSLELRQAIVAQQFSQILSPGALPLFEKSRLMDALRYLGYVRMAREGVRRIRDSMNESELPDPIFKQESLHGVVVRVTLMNAMRSRAIDRDVALYFGIETWRNLNEIEVAIMGFAFRNEMIHVSDAARITGRTWQTSKKDLERLAKKGLLQFESGAFIRDSSAHYRIAEQPVGDAGHGATP
jgi:ATP-dependent DNA helicase RecG